MQYKKCAGLHILKIEGNVMHNHKWCRLTGQTQHIKKYWLID